MLSHALLAGAISPDPHYLHLFVAPSVLSRVVRVLEFNNITVMANCMSNVLKICSPTESSFLDLPEGGGMLPMWQIAVAAAALFNTVQNFVTLHFTKQLYNNVPAAHPGIFRSQLRGARANLMTYSSNAITGAYVWYLDVDRVRSAVVCRLQHSQ